MLVINWRPFIIINKQERNDAMYNELYHHGVKGQEWGKQNGPPYPLDSDGKAALREQRNENSEGSKRKLKKRNKEYKKDYKDASDNRRLLSDEELGYRINRLRQERELKRLTNESERPIRTMISEVAFNASKKVLSEIGAKTLMYGAKSIMKKEKMTLSGAAEYIFNKNKNRNPNTNNTNNEDDD